MSAYLCSPAHIGILAQRIAAKTSGWGDAPTVAETLATENLQSVASRYSHSIEKAAQDFMGIGAQSYIQACKTEATITANSYVNISPARLIGMVECSEYQSCEHEGWGQSEARNILAYLLSSALHAHMEATGVTTGWGWHGEPSGPGSRK